VSAEQEAEDPGRALIHEFRNLLAVIVNYSELIADETDNPEAIKADIHEVRTAAERFWKRLEQIERSPAYDPDKIFFRWEELSRQAETVPQTDLKELAFGVEDESNVHLATRPSLTFHGNMQVAIAEARNLVESGNRVAFFASSAGEVERVADILTEYGIAFQLGLDQGMNELGDIPSEYCNFADQRR